jgi:hypothetical protein
MQMHAPQKWKWTNASSVMARHCDRSNSPRSVAAPLAASCATNLSLALLIVSWQHTRGRV